MSIVDDYKKIIEVFSSNRLSYTERMDKLCFKLFTTINWSDTFLDFFKYESILNQLKKKKIYAIEKASTVKNHFIDDKLIYSVNNDNFKWGAVFVDYEVNYSIWLFFSENINEEMDLRQIKINSFEGDRICKTLFYHYNDDFDDDIKETFMVYNYEYDVDEKLVSIIRNGFYQNANKIAPPIVFSFEYDRNKVKVIATQEKFKGDPSPTSIIFNGKI